MNESTDISLALKQYGEELEAIFQSLNHSMLLFGMLKQRHQEEIKKTAEQDGVEIEEEGNSFRISVPSDKAPDYKKLVRKLNSIGSSQYLTPRNFLVALLCTYDAFLGKVLRYILESNPEILDASDRTLTFSDLNQFNDLDSAKQFLVEKEVENVLRKSHVDHFEWLEKKLNTPFKKGLESWPTFVELTQRRNLFVHTDGIVSTQYISVCSKHQCNIPKDRVVGKKLGVSPEYFKESYQCLYEIGIKMAHVVWRKLKKEDIELIDSNLIDITFQLVDTREYVIAIKVLEFFTQSTITHASDTNFKILYLNLAQAHKWSGNESKCIELLDAHDWSSSEEKFKLCVAVLRNEWTQVYKHMRVLAHDEDFANNYYQEWPIFMELRKEQEFKNIYKECYKEEFPQRETIEKPQKIEQEGMDI